MLSAVADDQRDAGDQRQRHRSDLSSTSTTPASTAAAPTGTATLDRNDLVHGTNLAGHIVATPTPHTDTHARHRPRRRRRPQRPTPTPTPSPTPTPTPDSNPHADPDPDTHTDPDSDPHTDPDSHSYTNACSTGPRATDLPRRHDPATTCRRASSISTAARTSPDLAAGRANLGLTAAEATERHHRHVQPIPQGQDYFPEGMFLRNVQTGEIAQYSGGQCHRVSVPVGTKLGLTAQRRDHDHRRRSTTQSPWGTTTSPKGC